jgi:virginiamycin B lyase
MRRLKGSTWLACVLFAGAVLFAPAGALAAALPALAFTPSTNGTYDFGAVKVGETVSQTFTLTNSGGSASAAITIALSGSEAFTQTADTCTGTSLGPKKSCIVTVDYTPEAAGQTDVGTLTATAKKLDGAAELALTGTGAAIRHVYWAQTLSDTIGRAGVDGSDVNQSFIVLAAGSLPHDVAVDSSHVYWTSGFSGSIGRADLDGQNVDPNFITGLTGCCDGLAVDGTYMYWAAGFAGTIGRADINGQNVNPNFITGLYFIDDVTVDLSHIYWTIFGTWVGRADLDGQNVDEIFINGDLPAGVAVDSSYIYWSNTGAGNSIGRADLDGQNIDQNFITGSSPRGVALDSSHIYWGNLGSLGRADLDGHNVDQSFISGPSAIGVAVDGG